MVPLTNEIFPIETYNSLPNINDCVHVPSEHAADIADLKALLEKHNLPDNVRIKLIHTHFSLLEGEVFAGRYLNVPKHGRVGIMQPLDVSKHTALYGYHYFVDDGKLIPYEYMEEPGPDLPEAFVRNFCQMIQERGLQRKLGLTLRHSEDHVSTNELECPAKRICIDVPIQVCLPASEHGHRTTTEFTRDWPKTVEGFESVGDSGLLRRALNSTHQHYAHHCKRPGPGPYFPRPRKKDLYNSSNTFETELSDNETDEGLLICEGESRVIRLGGGELDRNSDLYDIVSYISDHT